jgi:uncharacterized protein (DUF2252 family)
MHDIHTRITEFNKSLLPDMVQLKYNTMAENIFSFYRGTCHLFYEDLSKVKDLPKSPLAWICGDLHLENFGSYKGDTRVVYFDLNDFDEGVLSPANWEILRMVTSILVAFDNLKMKETVAMNIAKRFLDHYSATLVSGKARGIDPRTAQGIVCTFLTTVEERKQKQLLKKRTCDKKQKILIPWEPKEQFELDKPLKKKLGQHINQWMSTSLAQEHHFEVIDAIFRLAGTGSVGVKRYLFLLKSLNIKNRYLLLDMKQARVSSLAPYVKVQQPDWATEADRVMGVKQRMQNVLPALQGTSIFDGDAYTLQEMQPTEDKINFELIKNRYNDIDQVIEDMAMLTASAQLRSSGRQGSAIADELIAYGENTGWHDSTLNYARQYAKQVKLDYMDFVRGYKKGPYKR